jgi:hypothetical protein
LEEKIQGALPFLKGKKIRASAAKLLEDTIVSCASILVFFGTVNSLTQVFVFTDLLPCFLLGRMDGCVFRVFTHAEPDPCLLP